MKAMTRRSIKRSVLIGAIILIQAISIELAAQDGWRMSPFSLAVDPQRGRVGPMITTTEKFPVTKMTKEERIGPYPESLKPNEQLDKTLRQLEFVARADRLRSAARYADAVRMIESKLLTEPSGETAFRERLNAMLAEIVLNDAGFFDRPNPSAVSEGIQKQVASQLRARLGESHWRVIEVARAIEHSKRFRSLPAAGQKEVATLLGWTSSTERVPDEASVPEETHIRLNNLLGPNDFATVGELEQFLDRTNRELQVERPRASTDDSSSQQSRLSADDFRNVLKRHNELLAAVEADWGKQHPRYAAAIVRLCTFFERAGKPETEGRSLNTALEAIRQTSDRDSQDLRVLYNLDVDELCRSLQARALRLCDSDKIAECRIALRRLQTFQHAFYGPTAWQSKTTTLMIEHAERHALLTKQQRDELERVTADLDPAPGYLRNLAQPIHEELIETTSVEEFSGQRKKRIPDAELDKRIGAIDRAANTRLRLLGADRLYRSRLFFLKGTLTEDNRASLNSYRQALSILEGPLGADHLDCMTIISKIVDALERRKRELQAEGELADYLRNNQDLDEFKAKQIGPYHWSLVSKRRYDAEIREAESLPVDKRERLEEMDRLAAEIDAFTSRSTNAPAEAMEVGDEAPGETRQGGTEIPAAAPAPAAPPPPRFTTLRAALNAAGKVYKVRSAILGADHSSVENALFRLAALNEDAGNLDRAADNYHTIQTSCLRKFGKLHPTMVECLQGLARISEIVGDFKGTEALHTQAEAIENRIGIRLRPQMEERTRTKMLIGNFTTQGLANLQQLFAAYFDDGNFVEAVIIGRQWADGSKKLYGETHRNYAICLANLANMYSELGDYPNAQLHYQLADGIFRASPSDREYLKILHNWAIFLDRNEQKDKAVALLEKELEKQRDLGDTDSVNRAHTYSTLASVEHDRGRVQEAKAWIDRAIAMFEKLGATDHAMYRLARNERAFLKISLGQFGDAAKELRQLKESIPQRLRESDLYAEIAFHLGVLHDVQSENAHAAEYFHQSLEITHHNLERATVIQSPRQQMAMAAAMRRRLDAYLSLADRASLPASDVYEHVVAWKGAALLRREELLARATSPQLQHDAQQLKNLSDELAGTILASLNPNKADREREAGPAEEAIATGNDDGSRLGGPTAPTENSDQKIQRLTREKEALEESISSQWLALRKSPINVDLSLRQIRAALGSESVLVDFVRYRRIDWQPRGTGERGAKDRYSVFIVRTNGVIESIDRGAAEPIDSAVLAWRQQFGRVKK